MTAGGSLRLVLLVVLGTGLVVGVGGLAYWNWIRDPGPLRTTEQRPAPGLRVDADPTRGSMAFVDGGSVVAGPDLVVAIDPPPGATQMQVGFDPTFASTPWVPVAGSVTVTTNHVGHQMLFGRFRAGDGAEPSPVSVDAVSVDPTFEAATSSLYGVQQPSWARPLSTRTIVIRIEAGRLQRGAQERYDFDRPPAGDQVSDWFGLRNATVERGGEPYGLAVEGSDRLLKRYDRLLGWSLDTEALDAGTWLISSTDDQSWPESVQPVAVQRISRPGGTGRGEGEQTIVPLVHDLVLQLPIDLVEGASYEIWPPAGVAGPVTLVFDSQTTVSPAVHVNQNGYAGDDTLKVGYLSALFDGIGAVTYPEGLSFELIEADTGAVAYRGQSVRRSGGDELDKGDLTGTEVFELDFSAVADPGRYRLCVETVGCSESFPINDHVWTDLAVSVARAMYHQRSGIALGPPYTSISRNRPYHPDDGMVVRRTAFRLIDTFGTPLEEQFATLVAAGTETQVPEAWGGHFDAGDWDRRIQHLYYVRAVAELVELAPELFGHLDLGIPESGDQTPDLLDEGLWSLDLYRRMQGEDGSIRGAVEASDHPQASRTSWTDDLAVFAFDPDPWSSYLYAGVAAQVAAVLESYDQARADEYRRSALAAAAWAEAQPLEPGFENVVQEQRSVAAAALFKLTGDGHWHEIFIAATTLDDGVDSLLSCADHGRCDAAWIYLTIDPTLTEPGVRAMIEQSLVATAEEVLATAERTAFGWTVENRLTPLVWGLGPGGSPSSIALLRAYEISGDERYRQAALRSAAVSLGANPLNVVYVTGIGRQPVSHPLLVDSINGGLPVWAGTPIYGPHELNALVDETWVDEFVLGPGGVQPLADDVPYMWRWFDVSNVAMFNEYTVFQSHAEAIYAFGLLAGAGTS